MFNVEMEIAPKEKPESGKDEEPGIFEVPLSIPGPSIGEEYGT